MKLIMLKGLPGSGKTTVAKEYTDKGFVRVNKDSIREMLYFLEKSNYAGVFRPKLEKHVAETEVTIARIFLQQGLDVVVDDTNFDSRCNAAFSKLAEEVGAEYEVKDLNVSVEECILRDKGRSGGVGENVIRGMASRYNLFGEKKKIVESQNKRVELDKYVVVDMDGTLADCSHRLKYLHGEDGRKNWNKFFQGMEHDGLNVVVSNLVQSYNLPVVVVSARPEVYRKVTEEWLRAKEVPFYSLIMRKEGDYREDSVVKQEILDTFLSKESIAVVLDDRPQVLEMWRRNSLNVIDVTKDL